MDSHLHGNDKMIDKIKGFSIVDKMEILDSHLHGNDKMNEKIKGVFSNLL